MNIIKQKIKVNLLIIKNPDLITTDETIIIKIKLKKTAL